MLRVAGSSSGEVDAMTGTVEGGGEEESVGGRDWT